MKRRTYEELVPVSEQPIVPGFEHLAHEYGVSRSIHPGLRWRYALTSLLGYRVRPQTHWERRHFQRLHRIFFRNPPAGEKLLRRLGATLARRQGVPPLQQEGSPPGPAQP